MVISFGFQKTLPNLRVMKVFDIQSNRLCSFAFHNQASIPWNDNHKFLAGGVRKLRIQFNVFPHAHMPLPLNVLLKNPSSFNNIQQPLINCSVHMWGVSPNAQSCPTGLLVSACISTTFFMTIALEEVLMFGKASSPPCS